jgi:hypothetical protein
MTKSWRKVLPIHPATELLPRMAHDELRALGENGLRVPLALWKEQRNFEVQLLDGRSRLDAMERAGLTTRVESIGTDAAPAVRLSYRRSAGDMWSPIETVELCGDRGDDPYAYVISANIHRRHLTAEQKRELIAKLIKAQPEKSDRQIGKTARVSKNTVKVVRDDLEARGQIDHVSIRTDTKGRKQPAKRMRNYTRARLYRAAKLGDNVVARLKGTSLDNAREMDELVILNRGAPEGGHTEIVKRLIADAVTGKAVSAIAVTKNGVPPPRDDIGSNASEVARLQARNEELERENAALKREIEELRARLLAPIDHGDGLDLPGFLNRTRKATP